MVNASVPALCSLLSALCTYVTRVGIGASSNSIALLRTIPSARLWFLPLVSWKALPLGTGNMEGSEQEGMVVFLSPAGRSDSLDPSTDFERSE